MNAGLKHGDWTFNWQGFFTSASSDYRFADQIITYRGMPGVAQNLRMGAQLRHSISATYNYADKMHIQFGIRNLFDATPPQVSSGAPENLAGNTPLGASQYDWYGRTYFARLNIDL
jgi:iron complex outermembrane receptor protein